LRAIPASRPSHISVDNKKRELVGAFLNPRARWDLSPRLVNDHDSRSDSTGVAIPYGIYDLLASRGSIVVGVSHDTPAPLQLMPSPIGGSKRDLSVTRDRGNSSFSGDTGGSNGCRCRA